MDPILKELRQSFDGSEGFLKGHQIITVRKGYRRVIPPWAMDDSRFKDILLVAFPRMLADERERLWAGRWARVFYLYYKGNYTSKDISVEMDISVHVVKRILVKMRRVGEGLTVNGKPRGLRPRGNPSGKSRYS